MTILRIFVRMAVGLLPLGPIATAKAAAPASRPIEAVTSVAQNPVPGAVSTPSSERRNVEGWSVCIRRELLDNEARLTGRALQLLRKQLLEIVQVVPAAAVKELRRVPLFFSPEYPDRKPTAEFHPDAGWLRANGRDPAMAKAIEFSNIRQFEAEMNRMPNFTLHELAHAYHDRVLPQGFANPDIKAAYERARASGKYDRVERWFGNGKSNTFERAYALTDAMEYFAESSEAFFSRNDFFPFTGDELKAHDPEMFALLEKLWGVQMPAPRDAGSEASANAARPGGLMADSPVTFPKQGALPARFPPDVKDQSGPAEKDYYIFSSPCRSLAQIATIQKEMPPGQFTPPPPDWKHVPRTRRILTEGGELRLLALGDSIVNDTMRSGWVALLQDAYPKARIQATVFVRGGGGCQHYREEDRVVKYILPRKPDLVFIGGISQRDIESIREVIRQLRGGLPGVEFLLATGTFGAADPRDPVALAQAPYSGTGDYGRALQTLATEQRCAYLDMTGPWAEYLRSANVHPYRFYRDVVHANEFGEQILAKIMLAFWTAPDRPESAEADVRTVRSVHLAYAPAPPDNPLKGFVPYLRADATFPHSLEWDYTRLSDVMTGPTNFNWAPFDAKLGAAASRGHQFFARFYLEWPGKTTGVPQYLLADGLKLRTWTNTNTQPFPAAVDHTPDYEDPRLRAALMDFIHAFGRRYDGDPRLGFVGLGLLGTWGEWHNHPHNEWFASKTVQREVLDAYEAAFKKTKLVARYPAGTNDARYADNRTRAIGYHDDSFAWATVHTGNKSDAWFFESRLRVAGALDKWRTQPIGGEVRPEVWLCLFDEPSCAPKGQEFDRCVAATHASWLCNEGVFRGKIQGAARERAIRAAQRMGYELHVASANVAVSRSQLSGSLAVTNTGVAPFYYDWPVELAALDVRGSLAGTWKPEWKLTEILPGEPATAWRFQADVRALPTGAYHLLLRVPNPLTNGSPLRFANQTQDQHLPGWLTLGKVELP